MRLTNTLREQFVTAVLSQLPPVPSFNTEDWQTQFRSAMEAGLPAPVLAFARDYPRYVARNTHHTFYFANGRTNRIFCPRRGWRRDGNTTFHYSAATIWTMYEASEIPPDLAAAAMAAHQTFRAAADEREALAKRLEEVTAACATTEALAKAFPEFAHLVPETIAPRKLPVAIQTNQLVADLVKAGLKLEAPTEEGGAT